MANKSGVNPPAIQWDGKELKVSVPLPEGVPRGEGVVLEYAWKPGAVAVFKVRESGTDQWSPGFVTPLNCCQISGLKPDTEYEMQVVHQNERGESPPAFAKVRTHPDGSLGSNVVPFPNNPDKSNT